MLFIFVKTLMISVKNVITYKKRCIPFKMILNDINQ